VAIVAIADNKEWNAVQPRNLNRHNASLSVAVRIVEGIVVGMDGEDFRERG
jgi:hypothetical protein